jgi:hypothetical protein
MKRFVAVAMFVGFAATMQAAQPGMVRPVSQEGASLGEGDVLFSTGDGQVAWYHDGSFVATLSDSKGLLTGDRQVGDLDSLYITDAEGNQVQGFSLSLPPTLFLSDEAPERVFLQREATRAPLAVTSTLMVSHGGTVLVSNKTMAIFWGSQWSSASFAGDKITGLDSFFGGFGGSSYAGASTEYTGTNGQVTANSTYLGHAIDTSTPPKRALSTSSAVAEACKITGNNPDPSALYLIYTSTGAGHVGYCAWHSYGSCSNGKPVQVAYMPNLDGVAGCSVNDGGLHSAGLAALASVTAHELSETITDPRNGGWYDSSNQENGDKCAWVFYGQVTLSNGSKWVIQPEWSNAAYTAGTGLLNRNGEPGCKQ